MTVTGRQKLNDRSLLEPGPNGRPSLIARGLASLSLGVLVGLWMWGSGYERRLSDFAQVWFGARKLLERTNPYIVVGPGLEFDWPAGLHYPASALVVASPFASLSASLASILFTSISAALLVFAVTKDNWLRLPILASAPFLHAMLLAQWSPILTAALLMPGLAWIYAAKPNLAIALLAAATSWRPFVAAAAGALALSGIAFLLYPPWFGEWLTVIAAAPNMQPPVAYWGGPLVLLALLRWRRPEARLLVILACIPHTTLLYETLPLLLIPQKLRQLLVLCLLSFAAYLLAFTVAHDGLDHLVAATGQRVVILMYLPCLVMVLRRPNVGGLSTLGRVSPLQQR